MLLQLFFSFYRCQDPVEWGMDGRFNSTGAWKACPGRREDPRHAYVLGAVTRIVRMTPSGRFPKHASVTGAPHGG